MGWYMLAVWRLDAEMLRAAKAEFAELERAGIVCWSDSPWMSPHHMVKKADGSWWPFGDYRNLNTANVHLHHPQHDGLTVRVAGSKVFSKIDMRKWYH